MAYGDFKDLTRKAASDKILCDKAFNIGKNAKCDGNRRRPASVVYKVSGKNSSGETVKNEDISNKELVEETNQLHKPIIRNFKKGRVHSSFIYHIWGDDRADMELVSKFNKVFSVIDIFSKYAWLFLQKIKKVLQLLMLFQKF